MKKLLAILVVATMLVSIIAITPVMNAATADTVIDSAEGTAVVDGVKDDAYANAVELVMDQCGSSNGGGAVLDTPAGYVYVINDAEWVYVFYHIIDGELDNTSTNFYEQDSIELFYMDNNVKQQWRIHYDEGNADGDQTKVNKEWYAVVLTDEGYDVECKFPITDVLNNQIEMLVQIDACTAGKRDATVYISDHPEGDDGWQRDNRQTDYDCWWTLQLVGEFEDTRVDPVPEAAELTAKNIAKYRDENSVYAQLYTQNTYDWSGWASIGSGENLALGETIAPEGWQGMFAPVASYTVEQIPDWSKMPIFAIQISDNNFLKFSSDSPAVGDTGDSGEYVFTYTEITVKANGYDDVVIPGGEISTKWTVKQESGYLSGQGSTIDLIGPAATQLGLDVEGACTWLANVTDVVTTISFNSLDLLTIDDITAFEEGLAALEQEWAETNDKVVDGIAKAAAALEAAQAEGADLAGALSDATKAFNAANKARENEGWAEGGIADTYIKENIGAVVDQIQALVDAAPAEEEPAEEPTTDAPEETADSTSSTSSEGGSTGLVVGIVVAVVVVIAAVCGIVLGKKKK